MLNLLPWKMEGTNGDQTVHPLDLFRRFDRALDHYFQPQAEYTGEWGIRQRETDQEFFLSLDAPGFEASEFDIQAHEEALTVSARHLVKEGDEERVDRAFQRQFTLAKPIDAGQVEASYKNGVLELRLPKAAQARWNKVAVRTV